MKNLRAAIYIRVSTLDQAREGYSLDAQEKALRKWCADHGHEVYDLYADRGISGKDIDHRPEMQRLLQDAKEQKFDVILFWALSRFTRSVSDLYKTIEVLEKFNVGMVSYTEAFDTSTPMGRAIVGVAGVFAQLERELTGERVAAALAERASCGKCTSTMIMGYDRNGDSLKVNETEAKYVRFCFNEYLKCKNVSRVARELRRMGCVGKRGAPISAQSVKIILTSVSYCGYNKFNGKIYKGAHKAIIDVETFNKVASILQTRAKVYGKQPSKHIMRIPDP